MQERAIERACASACCLSECDTVFAAPVPFVALSNFLSSNRLFLLFEAPPRTFPLRNPSARGGAGLSPSPPPPCIPSHTQPSRRQFAM